MTNIAWKCAVEADMYQADRFPDDARLEWCDLCLPAWLPGCLAAWLPGCLPACLPACLSLCLSVSLSLC